MIELSADFVITVHDEIIAQIGGLRGFGGSGASGVEAALQRVAHHALYANLEDIFAIAAMYAEAIARGHAFNDGNKRTALACAIIYLEQQGYRVRQDPILEDATVELATGGIEREQIAWLLHRLSTYRPI